MKIRPAVIEDLDRIGCVCDTAWGGIWQGNKQMFWDRIQTFPEGGILVGELDGVIEGYISCQRVDEETILRPSWNEATDFGSFKKTHNPQGLWLHIAGLAVTLKGSCAGLTGELAYSIYQYRLTNSDIYGSILGCRSVTRLSGYHRYQHQLTPEEYVNTLHNGKPIDTQLRVFERYGLKVVQPPVIFHNYVDNGGDANSCGYSVLLEFDFAHYSQ